MATTVADSAAAPIDGSIPPAIMIIGMTSAIRPRFLDQAVGST
jgi:hypothetical protein